MPYEVFISHASADKTVADSICAALESNGVRCWIAPRDILPGMSWPEAIMTAIEETQIMVLVFSQHAERSEQVMRELTEGVNTASTIIPFRIENLTPTKAFKYFLSVPHWLDALTPPLEEHLQKLTDSVCTLLKRQPTAPAWQRPGGAVPAKPRHAVVTAISEGEFSLDQLGRRSRRGLVGWLQRFFDDR